MRLILTALAVVSFAYFCGAFPAHAQSTADQVFGAWVRVTPETMTQPVPAWHYQSESLGSVTNEYKKKDRPAQPGGPSVSPRPTILEQVAGLQTNLPERR